MLIRNMVRIGVRIDVLVLAVLIVVCVFLQKCRSFLHKIYEWMIGVGLFDLM